MLMDKANHIQNNTVFQDSNNSRIMKLSLNAKRMLKKLPRDGRKLSTSVLKYKVKLESSDFMIARNELSSAGLIEVVKGKGIGRIKGEKNAYTNKEHSENSLTYHNQDYTNESNLSLNANKILQALPLDGTKVGNKIIYQKLNFTKEVYLAGKRELKKAGLILIGKGRGGSIGRARRQGNTNSFFKKHEKILNIISNPRESVLDSGQLAPSNEIVSVALDNGEELYFDEEDDDDIGDLSIQDRKIFTDKSDPSVLDLYTRFKEGELILQPDFQRQFVWDYKKCSRLIESAILEVPLPMIYLAEEADGREAVIDGQQRLTAFFKFFDSEYPLTGINVHKELRGKYFADLDRYIQNSIKRCSIRTTTIKKESSELLRFEIFERLNTGAVSLNDQELRNCIFRGPYNELLKDLSNDSDFKYLIGITKLERRMRDVELMLRFAAFYHTPYLNYSSPMRKFLNDDMSRYQNISDNDSNDLKKAFKNTLHIIRSLFDKHAFRRFYRGTSDNANGYWEEKTFSASLYDVLMYSFAKVDKPTAYRHLDAIREAFIHCMTQDDNFIETIERGTSNKVMIVRRFDRWRLTLDSIIGNASSEPRCFSMQIKDDLFNRDPTCLICNQRIQNIDDAAVDHIDQYWRGGLTIPENARLAHRFCNWSRSRRD